MKKLLLPSVNLLMYIGVLLVTIGVIPLTSCNTTRYIPLPEHHTEYIHDTILRADSIYVSHYETYHPSPSGEGLGVRLVTDTVLKYLYRDKVVEVIQHDSIQYPVEVPIEVAKPIPRFYVNCTLGFFLLLLALLAYIALRIYFRRSP